MTTGVVFFAHNTESIDYVRIAEWNAKNVQRHLNLPVTLITSTPTDSFVFDNVIVVDKPDGDIRHFQDQAVNNTWRNRGRADVYELTPYDTTLLLDVDYIVASDQLKILLDDPRDFICPTQAYEATQTHNDLNTLGQYKFPMAWATVIKFNKTAEAKLIFDTMRMIQNNYRHYSELYSFPVKPFRNDFALSIALTMLSGHLVTERYSAPFKLINVNPSTRVTRLIPDRYELTYERMVNKKLTPRRIKVDQQDIHVMGKSYLEALCE